ncbi:valyl-tRNA synthetase [Thermosipho melanesiensis]|uniref:Valine--tRNA ligase n=2 Tax=Thermosipho melanesiensis TaxID=46541 RepID=A6LNB2_THEM4|nr:valine--tRNA ligase [Thermosipho melanesiensis]ABR31413.1 valyl-tRNA synthetase [Thermosipho melanesiensis BI429]APT74472.1 valyl-tRNA synthetase [Thermosipho melanesiensis]OOC36432.1 valyl-tRNA synthetase [Thermosipho melanesiensis]OOC37250.1 valyl-tRNA synthetase [Thermosipho melanesiensis]OOC38002.1 valyl-tRNA synthetase [Thermosipho melanesiensis]
MNKEIGTRYEPNSIEKKWYKFWLEKGYFTPQNDNSRPKYSIVIPPPNITGKIHMGHALNITLQDILTRYKRMNGFKTLWLPGEDHAGIATQTAVEKKIEKEGKKREDLGRKKFLEIVWDWASTYRKTIKQQIMAIGASVDWSRERFTLDEGLSKAVKKVFVSLYKKGLIYKGKYIVNWCPRCKTVLSDEEVEYHEHDGKLYYIKYPFVDGTGEIVIATTRPETMLGDTAVAVSPSDERYKDVVGKEVILPLVGRKIKIIADIHADPKFGTGALKVTPAHDPNDYLIGQRHNLEFINIFNDDMTINENGGKYKGLDRYEAREKIVEDLEKEGFLVKIENLKHSVGHCYRCDTVIEPMLMNQWFVKMEPLAKKAIDAVENEHIKFYPQRWKKVYLNWMYNIRDWCISRQLWWGHRIPIWYCQDCGHINVSEDKVTKCEKCGSTNLRQEEDVLDTWFSSALWPFSTLGWPNETKDLKEFYPTDVLVTGFDIIFFWVARMIMMGYEFMDEKPFSDVYIHQLVRDKFGRKMSKSLGNGIDPIEVIEEYGADPMRFSLSTLAAQGRDIKLDLKHIETSKKFANKIWNATRFVILNLEDFQKQDLDNLNLSDKWILSRLQKTIKNVTHAIENYEFNVAAKEIYNFFWDELCDWYIEISKPRLKTNERSLVQNVLVYVLDNSLKLLHPIMPFITEELWQKLPTSGESITISNWPKVDEEFIDEESERKFSLIMNITKGIRNVKAEINIPQSKKVNITTMVKFTDEEELYIKVLGNVENITFSNIKPEKSASAYVDNNLEVYVELGNMIDIDSEINRLNKKIEKLEKDAEKFRKKLSNKKFLEGAPEDIIEEAREKLETIEGQIEKIKSIINSLQ